MWQALSMIIYTSQIYSLKDNLFSIFSVRTYFPSSQFVLFRFFLILKRLKFFIFHREQMQPTLELKWKGWGGRKKEKKSYQLWHFER